MKKLLTLVAISAISLSAVAHAESSSDLRFVIGQDAIDAQGNLSLSDNSSVPFKDSAESETIGFALRTHFTESWGSELRYMMGEKEYFTASGEEFALDVNSTLFLSGLYKGPHLGKFVPYAKLGLGMVSMEFDGVQVKEATYVAGLGVDYNASDAIVMGFEYEHFGDVDFNESTTYMIDEQAFSKGVRGEYDMSRVSVNIGFRF